MLKNYLMVFFVSMVPVIELRGAIPIGLGAACPAQGDSGRNPGAGGPGHQPLLKHTPEDPLCTAVLQPSTRVHCSALMGIEGFFCIELLVGGRAAAGQPSADTPWIHPWRLDGRVPAADGRLIGYPRRHIHAHPRRPTAPARRAPPPPSGDLSRNT